MTGSGSALQVPAGVREMRSYLSASMLLQAVRRRVHERAFWNVQLMVVAVTAIHLAIETTPAADVFDDAFDHLHHLPPLLYAVPIVYASLKFGREGGVLTGLVAAGLTLIDVFAAHRAMAEGIVQLSQITTLVAVGIVLSNRVEYEVAVRRRAEEMAERLAIVNQQITRAQEAERTRIARELHDDTVQALVVLGHQLDGVAATPGLSQAVRGALDEVRQTADATLAGVRQFSRDLRPSILDHLGLVAALSWLTQDVGERAGIVTRLDVTGTARRLPPETELTLFRIAQESLRNVEKHANARETVVALSFKEGSLELTVSDDGEGFDPSPPADHFIRSGRLGITGMAERAQLIGGRLTINSTPGRGTRVMVTVGL